NDYTIGTITSSWTLTGAGAGVGNQVFENDGSLNIIGTAQGSGATTTASIVGNVYVTGSGDINVYGNANLVIGSGVGIANGETIDFVKDQTGTVGGTVTEASALLVGSAIGGYVQGDTLILQNLIGSSIAPTETVIDGNGYATVDVLNGTSIVDSVTFRGLFF